MNTFQFGWGVMQGGILLPVTGKYMYLIVRVFSNLNVSVI